MSNGDSLDGFVFPPFIPTASTRPPAAPAAPPQEPAPAVEPAGRMTMPWDLETPVVRPQDEAPAPAAAAQADADEGEDLPWLEVPAPREADAPAAEAPAAPAQDEAFPEWLAWDQRDETAALADARDTVAPVAGLEDFVPMDDMGGLMGSQPTVTWTDAQPEAAAEPAPFEPAPPPMFDAAPEAEPFPEMVFDDAPSADAASAEPWAAPSPADDEAAPSEADAWAAPSSSESPAAESPAAEAWAPVESEPAPAEAWSLAAPEAAEPPAVYDAPMPGFDESPAAAAPSFEVSVDDGALIIQPAEPESAAGGDDADFAPEPAVFVADDEAVLASEPEPVVADDAAAPAEPDPFTAAAVAEAEAVAPIAPSSTSSGSPFDDVAARLEAIAHMLRERPDELLSGGSSDPLALLVTGYVMGYTARGGR